MKFPNSRNQFIIKKLSSVYAGKESQFFVLAHRNLDGLVNIFENNDIGDLVMIGNEGKSTNKVKFKGYLPRSTMYDEMMNNSIGLVPMKKHWSQVFISPNKAFEYAHSGLFVLATSSFQPIKEYLGSNCIMYEDNDELIHHLEYFKTHLDELYAKRIAIFKHARENYRGKIMNPKY